MTPTLTRDTHDDGHRVGWVHHHDGTWSELGKDGLLGERFRMTTGRVISAGGKA